RRPRQRRPRARARGLARRARAAQARVAAAGPGAQGAPRVHQHREDDEGTRLEAGALVDPVPEGGGDPMRLGLTSSTYQYLFGGWLFPDRSKLDFNLYGQPYPYFAQTPVHVDPAQQLEWLIEKTARLELDVIHAGIA